ncbi:MAG: CPBP family intramembrane metalloprotease [Gemmatimonadota bacterium]|nr:CPBP family intramembrane metalloprotease [Gemmatimonadota bacterium]
MHALGFSSWLFLAFVAIGLPYAAFTTGRHTRSAAGPAFTPSRTQLHLNALASQLLVFGIAWYAGWLAGLRPLQPVTLTPGDFLAGAATLAIMGGMAWVSHAVRSDEERRRLWVLGLLPRTGAERVTFALLAAVAAVSEELAYRGVAFALFTALTGNAWAGAALAAAAFAGAHFPQGGKSMAIIFVIGLVKQGLVAVTGTLWIAIGVHFVYDVMTAATMAPRLAKLDASAAGTPRD